MQNWSNLLSFKINLICSSRHLCLFLLFPNMEHTIYFYFMRDLHFFTSLKQRKENPDPFPLQ